MACFQGVFEEFGIRPTEPKDEQHCQRGAIKIVNELFGITPAADFGPIKLRIVRDAMITKGWSRSYVNRSVKRVRHIFRWGVSWEFVPETVANALGMVECLKAGESDAPESKPRRAVSPERLAAVRAELNPRHRDIFDLLLLTGARPGEVLKLTTGMIDRTGEIWRVDLTQHKTAHKGKERKLFFNPTAQAILLKYLQADPSKRLFAIRRDNYGQAVKKACERAFGMPKELRLPGKNLPPAQLAEIKRQAKIWRREHVYTPLRFRRRKALSQPSDLKTRDGGMLHQKWSFAKRCKT
jgi:integrase